MPDLEFDSTLIRHGRDAVTYTDMREFARDIETRPIVKLLQEIPALAAFAGGKFSLAKMILHRRFRNESPLDQLQLQSLIEEIASNVLDPDVAARVLTIFTPDTD